MVAINLSSRVRRFLRYIGIAIGLYVTALLLYAIAIFFITLISGSEPASTTDTIDSRLSQALVNWQLKKIASPLDSKALDDARLLLLEVTAEHFRQNAFITTETPTGTSFQQVAPKALQDMLNGKVSQAYPHLWSYLMAGAFPVFGYALGDFPVVAYYNPYFDLVLMTQWAISNTGFVPIQAWPTTGRAFIEDRDSLASDKQIGKEPGTLFEVQIVNAAQGFTVVFEDRVPPLERLSSTLSIDPEAKKQAISIAENRIFSLVQWVNDARDPAKPINYAKEIDALQQALSATSSDDLKTLLPADNPQKADELFLLPANNRESMQPYLVIDRNVIFIDPNRPTVFLSSYFEPAGQGYTLALALLFDLHKVYPSNNNKVGTKHADK